MKGKYTKRIGGFLLTAVLFSGIVFVSPGTAEAQGRRRVIIRRPYTSRFYRPFGFGYRDRWNDPWGYNRWGFNRYDPWSPYGSQYRQYVFSNSEDAVRKAYEQGFKTGKDDGKKSKSYDPQRSHYYREAGFGNFGEVYRTAFSRGYQEGYRAGSR